MCQGTPFTYPITGERLERLKAKNPEDWAQWIRQESPALASFLRSRLQRRKDAEKDTEDALQLTWLLAWQKVGPEYTRSELYRAYLFCQAQASATQVTRKGGHEHLIGNRGGHDNDGGDDDDFESSLLGWLASRGIENEESLRRRLEELLDVAQPKLSGTERTIVVLKIYEGPTFAEIAATLDLPPGTVSSTYYRALEKVLQGLLDLAEPPLTERERELFIMHRVKKKEFHQTAQELPLPLATVLEVYREAEAKIWQGLLGLG